MGAGGTPRTVWALLAVLAFAFVLALGFAVLLIGYPWEWFTGESMNAYFANRLAEGGPLYEEWSDDNLIAPIYPPGMYLILAPFHAVFGFDLWVGRTLALIAFLLAAGAAYAIGRRLGCTRLEAAASALALFSFTIVGFALIAAARPDAFVVGFAAGMLAAATAWEDRRTSAFIWLTAAAAIAVIATKQNFAPLVLGVLVSFWLRDRRAALALTLATAGGTLGVFALVEVASDGAFLDNMRDFARTGYSWTSLRETLESELLPYPNPLYAVAAVEVGFALREPRKARAVHWTWIASLLVTVSALKVGAAGNYWAATALSSAILLGPALARLRVTAAVALPVAAAFVAILLAPAAVDRVRDLRDLEGSIGDLDSQAEAAVRVVDSSGGTLFADRGDLAVAAGHLPEFDPPVFRLLAEKGYWDPSPVAAALRAGEYRLVLVGFDLFADPIRTYQGIPDWPVEMVEAVRARFCPRWSAPGPPALYIYEHCR